MEMKNFVPSLEELSEISNLQNSESQEYPFFKRLRLAVYNYFARYYLRFIVVLITIIFFLITSVLILILLFTRIQDVSNFNDFITKNSEKETIFCEDVSCKKIATQCEPKEITYYNMQLMAHYSCFPTYYTMARYEEESLSKNIYFSLVDDVSKYSEYDLLLLPQIHNLRGTWRISVENEKIFYLVYSGITIHVDPPDPDETF